MDKVNMKIKNYIEKEILPKYKKLKGHTPEHIEEVILNSLGFAKQAPELNFDMVYVIAAYHDLGRLVDNETHNIESAKMLRADEFLKSHFTDTEIETMAEAVEDHRASLGREPRSIYGKLVSSADRYMDINTMLDRCYSYTKSLYPEISEDEVIERARTALRKKFSPNGYAAKTMYFDCPDFLKTLVKVEQVTRTPEKFNQTIKEFIQKSF
ncbi:HD domain-containing protein [Candidatus Saccharibacteria bacterium]|nr:HD domain-containing protein [Candidatus Saccharibacteria bacterium]